MYFTFVLDNFIFNVEKYYLGGLVRMLKILYYIIKNAISAEINNFYIIISGDSKDFQEYLK